VDFGSVKSLNFDYLELCRFCDTRGWRESEAAERRFLSMLYGKGVPHARARKILPLFEEWQDLYRPRGAGDNVIDFRSDRKKNPKGAAIQRRMTQLTLRDKLINPDFVYLKRGDIGIWHLLGEIGATVNVSEISRRVAAAPRTAQ
jgi:hypothetical protein